MGRSPRVTRDQVLEAARETFVEHGFAGTTLAQIGSRLSVSPAALLRHAPTKEALFLAAMGRPEPDLLPLEFLEEYDGNEDPRRVLRRVGEVFIPFLEQRIRGLVARWVYFKRAPEGASKGAPEGASKGVPEGAFKHIQGVGRIPLPFDPRERPTPPQKNFRLLESYLRRAARRGRIRVKDPRAAALAFLATLHSYVFMQQVMEILEEPLPVEEYLDTVVDVWASGIVVGPKGAGPKRVDTKTVGPKRKR
jgi:AcrR family transcriptional regulator